jgi:pyruvate/2-oxoglutarate dehydrogenase complex dihydrolipoamide acyltransferase (E2) component
MGLVAQQVEEVLPEWVDTDPSGYKNLTVRGFEALTVEAFRELTAENEALKSKSKQLEERIKDLEVNVPKRVNDREPEATGGVVATKAAEGQARELGVRLSDVKGTRSGGRVLVRDVERAAKRYR